MRSQIVQFEYPVKSSSISSRYWAPTLMTMILTPTLRQAILVHHSIHRAYWSDFSASCLKANVLSLIFCLFSRGGGGRCLLLRRWWCR